MASMSTLFAIDRHHVVAIGDSTLDNLIWMDEKPDPVKDCVIGQLRSSLPSAGASPARVTNLAADGFTSANVLHGAMPMLSRTEWARHGEPFPSDKTPGGVLFPLDELEKLHARDPVTHVLLSVGGNDVRLILHDMHQLPTVMSTFHTNYSAICERMLRLGTDVKIIIMLQYQVCLAHEHGGYGVYGAMSTLPGPGTGQQKLQQLMERIYAPVISLAKSHKIPVIDLPRTFDPADETLYRLQIEPSLQGGALIAKVISGCIATHDFNGPSRLYSTSPTDGALRSEENNFESGEMPWTIVRGDGGTSPALAPSGELNTALAGRRIHVAALPHAVASLMEMGFDENAVTAALNASGNVPQQALELLLQADAS